MQQNGYVYIAFFKVVTEEDVDEFLDERDEVVSNSGGNIRFLSDLRGSSMLHSSLRKRIAERIKHNSHLVYRNAMLSDSLMKTAALTVMITFTGRRNIKVFNDYDKAFKWIKE